LVSTEPCASSTARETDVLRGDQLDLVLLAAKFPAHRVEHGRVALRQSGGEKGSAASLDACAVTLKIMASSTSRCCWAPS